MKNKVFIINNSNNNGRKVKTVTSSIRFLVILGQLFGLLPVDGVSSDDPDDLKFKWKSWTMFNTIISLICIVFFLIIGTIHLFVFGYYLPRLVDHVFYISGFGTSIIFFELARRWPKLMIKWTENDLIMEKNYGYPKNLDRNIRILTFFIMLFAAAEHLLSLSFHGLDTYRKLGKINGSIYYNYVFPQIFQLLPYSIPLATFAQYVSFISTVTWNYNDLFIIIISVILRERFKQITTKLEEESYNKKTLSFWKEIREDYNRLCNLCLFVDKQLSFVIILSFATNMFFILVQLLNSLKPISDQVEKIYFCFSFGFLIFRTVAVCLYAGFVNEASKEFAFILLTMPSDNYNNEVFRILLRIRYDNVSLSGHKMFKLTKGLILNVAGAIVTYELALMQFSGNYLYPTVV